MEYDRFQQEAIDYINQGFSVIVSAPTGAGKTAIAEHIIEQSINKNEGVIYTAPLKALSNQKFRDFKNQFADKVGILTGDVSINSSANVLIMTTEILRNKILQEPDSLKAYSWVIFDEVHYIDNYERGTVWEESLIFLPKHLKILCLSATIPNIKEFSLWLEKVHNTELKIVIENSRPVPLHFYFQCQNEIVDDLKKLKRLFIPLVYFRHKGRYRHIDINPKPNRLNTLINFIRSRQGFPLIYFVFGRRRSEELANELLSYNFLSKDEENRILSLFENLCERFDLKNEKSASMLYPLIKRGIAYHHAGMLPTLKEVIERLFTSKLLKVIFTTETFALGINMPARSVAFDDLRKYYGYAVCALKTRDFYQMAGRAGRRGMDKEGFVYLRVNQKRITQEETKRIIYGQPEKIYSQLNNSYATILNLYEKYKEDLYEIYPSSLHYFQSKTSVQKQALELLRAKINLLKELGYISNGLITPKGAFAGAVYGYELILSELYGNGFLEHLDKFGLGVLMSAIVFEPRKNQTILSLSKNAKFLKAKCDELIDKIHKRELKYRIYPLSKKPFFHLSLAVEAWLKGMGFQKVASQTDTDEGEIVRYFRMAVQLLREVVSAPVVSGVLKSRVYETIALINRDIIDAEKQLREG
ncbi:MAG: DEAD/DEAH box helicase [Candidatus Omnitrophica bacterium]|nr:DEAD/DEAH box helicase [Candidatus Omnitrophota bacterium]